MGYISFARYLDIQVLYLKVDGVLSNEASKKAVQHLVKGSLTEPLHSLLLFIFFYLFIS